MLINDSFAFVPLIAVFITAIFLFVLLIVAKKSRTNKVQISLFISIIVAMVGVIITIIRPSMFTLAIVLFAENILLIPHFLSYKNSVATEKQTEKEITVIEDIIKSEEFVQENSETETTLSLLDTSKNFIMQASSAFSEEAGLSRLLDFINNSLISEVKADGGVILLIDYVDRS